MSGWPSLFLEISGSFKNVPDIVQKLLDFSENYKDCFLGGTGALVDSEFRVAVRSAVRTLDLNRSEQSKNSGDLLLTRSTSSESTFIEWSV